jgi:hypothetical protein
MNENSSEEKTILLIGDWLLDEHWVTGTQSISTSTRTGDIYRFVYNDINQEIIYVSGAGRVASILLRKEDFTIYGLGVWEKNGEEVLTSFFTDYKKNKHRSRRNEFRINWEFTKKQTHDKKFPGNIVLKNLYTKDEKIEHDKIGTKRAIRIYEKIGPHIRLTERIDFMKSEEEDKISNICSNNIEKVLAEIKGKIDAVIIKDMNHGVITDDVIEALIKKFGSNTSWFISSKKWKPSWLSKFSGINIELLMIPQAAAKQAIKEENAVAEKLDNWMTASGWVTLEALEFIQNPGKFLLAQTQNVIPLKVNNLVILPELNRVIAYSKNNKKVKEDTLFIQPEAHDDYSEIDLPMASVYFPEIIKGILLKKNFEKTLKESLRTAILWRKRRFYTIRDNREPEQDNQELNDNNIQNGVADKQTDWHSVLLKNSKSRWEQAFSFERKGIIDPYPDSSKESQPDRKRNLRFELWRGMTTLDGYICLSKKRKAEIRKLLLNLKRERGSKLKRAEVCFIKAEPGSGKSYLVECLAKALDLKMISFNLSQIPTKTQIINCFDEISTAQAENQHNPLLIFFDEINTRFENTYPYSLFLAPLEDGYYLRDGHKFKLSPSIWIFVGTDIKQGNEDKASDLISRFTLPIVNLLSEKHEPAEAAPNIQKHPINESAAEKMREMDLERLEKIYYCVSFIRKTFKEVIEISTGAFEIFSNITIDEKVSPRDIRKFIESIEHIPYEKVDAECLKKTINRPGNEERIKKLFGMERFNNLTEEKPVKYVAIYDKPQDYEKTQDHSQEKTGGMQMVSKSEIN